MKTLEEIKDEYALTEGYTCWIDYINDYGSILDDVVDDICKRFAIEVAKEALRNAAENAEIEDYPDPNHGGYGQPEYYSRVNKESILSETNIPKL